MQQEKRGRTMMPRNVTRSNDPPTRYQRPSSAKNLERNQDSIFGKSRSNSARVKPEEFVEDITDEQEEDQQQHKLGCPWQKSRSRTRYSGVTESTSGTIHPRPWGARNPKDIPCFCQTSRSHSRIPSSTSPNRYQPSSNSGSPRPASKSSKKINDIVDNIGIFLERRKIRLTEKEVPFLVKKIEEKLQNFVDKPSKTSQQKQDRKEPAKKQRNPLSLSPVNRQQAEPPKQTLSRERMLELQKSKMVGGTQNFLGKMETKKCLLELTGDAQVPSNLRHLFGTMNPALVPADKMLFTVDDAMPQQAYLASVPDDYRQYSLKTIDMDNYTGVQLHHQAANTTLLLAANPRRQGQILVPKPQQVPIYKPSRRM